MNPSTPISSSVQNDVEIHGSLTFKGELKFGGQLTGGSIKGPDLTVNPGASVTGSIEGDALTLHGVVHGDVKVTGKCDIRSSAQLLGNLTANRLVMGEGATFVGRAQITTGKKDDPTPGPAAA